MLSIFASFCKLQPDFTYESVAYNKKLVFSSLNVVVFNDTFEKMIFLLTYSNFGVLFILHVFFCFLLFIFKIYLDQSNIFR